MPWDEQQLKKHLSTDPLKPVYLLYGEESWLTLLYASRIKDKVVGQDDLAGFNFHEFDGDTATVDKIEDAAEALPMMADRQCVLVKDMNLAAADVSDRILKLVQDPPPECVMIFRQIAVQPDSKKSARWKKLLEAVAKTGVVAEFRKKEGAELYRLLVQYARKRGAELTGDNAALLTERCGNDMNLLFRELDKLAALADGGEITRQHILTAATLNLEAKVFDLSRQLLSGRMGTAYQTLNTLLANREDPVEILAPLTGAFVDLYRAKVAAAGGKPATSLAQVFNYRGRDFVLRNAARDCARISLSALRDCLDILAETDRLLKSSSADPHMLLERALTQLSDRIRRA